MIVLKGRLIDGNGNAPIENGLVAVEGNIITYAGRSNEFKVPPTAQIIEVPDGTIMPGFIEGHCHLGLGDNYFRWFNEHVFNKVIRAERDMEDLLNGGFTSLRECGGMSNYLKSAWNDGLIHGPRIFSAGKSISQTNGHADAIRDFPIEMGQNLTRAFSTYLADGVSEVRKAARMQLREGADFLKIMGTGGFADQGNSVHRREYSHAELRAFVEEAEKWGTYVSAHCHGLNGIRACVNAGVKSIEHASYIDSETCEKLMAIDGWIVPTLATGYRARMNLDRCTPWLREKMLSSYDQKLEHLHLAKKMGVTIAFGADFGGGGGEVTPFIYNGLEFPLLVEEGGLSPMEAIMAATKTNARLIFSEKTLGTLEQGKLADIVVAKGNPLTNIKLLAEQKNIKVVMLDGKIKKQID